MLELAPAIFWLSTALVAHSYVVFPLHMRRWASLLPPVYPENTPTVDILLAVYNEEAVLEAKIHSSFQQTYEGPFRLLIGTDACTDSSLAIIQKCKEQYGDRLQLIEFKERQGKAAIINHLATLATADILVLTDADAFFEPHCLVELVKPFADNKVGGVQAHLILQTENGNEVAHEEAHYTYREMEIKQGEGRKGCIIGAFGACYAIRRHIYQPIPAGFVVDDFYLFMRVLQQKYSCVFAEKALYRLLLSGDAALQFRRKRRIGKGNFQNLAIFAPMLFRLNRTAYCFWSHKVLRWLTPILLTAAWLSALYLMSTSSFFTAVAGFISLAILLALLDQFLFNPLAVRIRSLRFLRHFLWMNLALLLGLWDALSGPRQGYWNNRP